jgi:urea transport system permease protein
MLAGIAGALYVPQVGIINPGEFSPINSIELVIWVAMGGRGTLYGAIIGAILVNYAKTWFTGVLPDAWLFMLGALFVVTTLYLPKGIAGLYTQIKQRQAEKKATSGNDSASKPDSTSKSATQTTELVEEV